MDYEDITEDGDTFRKRIVTRVNRPAPEGDQAPLPSGGGSWYPPLAPDGTRLLHAGDPGYRPGDVHMGVDPGSPEGGQTRYRYRNGEYGPNLPEYPGTSRVEWRTPEDLDYVKRGSDQVASAMLHAEDEAAAAADHHAVHHYSGGDVPLRVEVHVESAEEAAQSRLDERDANRPYIPITWRTGDGNEHYAAPIEIRDPSGNLIGSVRASDIQVTYHFDPQYRGKPFRDLIRPLGLEIEGLVLSSEAARIFAEMARTYEEEEARSKGDAVTVPPLVPADVMQALINGDPLPYIQSRVDAANKHRAGLGLPPLPVIGRDVPADPPQEEGKEPD